MREKVRISDNCTLGAYYFSSAKLYKDLYQEYYVDDSHMEKNEKYIAPLYNYMIEKGMTYHEDVAAVKDSFKEMLENGVYKVDLFSDL